MNTLAAASTPAKRTGRLMMNGELLAAGLDAVSVPASRMLEFNTAMIRFYEGRDATEMVVFMANCSLNEALRLEWITEN